MADLQLLDNPYIVSLTLIFLFVNMLAVHPAGVFVRQFIYIQNAGRDRIFADIDDVHFGIVKPVLILFVFIFTGIQLFLAFSNRSINFLYEPTMESILLLAALVALPAIWFVLHWILVNWFCYLFNSTRGIVTVNKVYTAIYTLLAPLVFINFLMSLLGFVPIDLGTKLLIGLLGLSQIAFILFSLKIFLCGFSSCIVICLYIIAFEVAPLWVFIKYIFG